MQLLSSELYNLLPFFLRAFGLLLLLPLDLGIGWSLKFPCSLALALFMRGAFSEEVEISLGLCIKEIFIGILIGLPLALLLEAASALGEIFDTARGQNVLDLIDPLRAQSNSRFGVLASSYLWVMLLLGGILEHLIRHLSNSYDAFPTAGVQMPASSLFLALCRVNLTFFTGTLKAFFPIAFLFCAVELALLSMQRALPNFFGQSEAMLLKTSLGLGVLILTLDQGVIFEGLSRFDWLRFSPIFGL